MAAKGDYPLPSFHFMVEWGNELRIGFTEISGLSAETSVIEYREGNSRNYNKSKQPGLTKYSNVTLKRGVFLDDHDFFREWRKTFFYQEGNKTGSMYRRTVIIKLLNENHEPVLTWRLHNAWPCKISWSPLKADGNEVVIESMELVHEGLEILDADG